MGDYRDIGIQKHISLSMNFPPNLFTGMTLVPHVFFALLQFTPNCEVYLVFTPVVQVRFLMTAGVS